MLLVAWLIAAFRPHGPYPILVLHGEQGSAKSTTSRVLRALLDPNTAPLRGEPRDLRDVMIAASNGWIISFDNLSRISHWLSDALCRLATGGGFSTRELYTDSEEVLFDAQRPAILNGIEELASRGDLLDRALILYLPSIAEQKREPESKFWSDFEAARPTLLGDLLDVVSGALAHLPSVELSKKPRLADFAIWVTAAEPLLGWSDGAFMDAYVQNQSDANDLALEASPIAGAIQALARDSGTFERTATDLLKALKPYTGEGASSQRSWPANGRALSGALRRLAPNLRKSGVDVSFSRSPNRRRRRLITIRDFASASSTSSEQADFGPARRAELDINPGQVGRSWPHRYPSRLRGYARPEGDVEQCGRCGRKNSEVATCCRCDRCCGSKSSSRATGPQGSYQGGAMNAPEVVRRIEEVGGTLSLNGDRIRYELPEDAAPMIEVLRQYRDEVFGVLRERRRSESGKSHPDLYAVVLEKTTQSEPPPMPAGVKLLRWEPMRAPVGLTMFSVVTEPQRFIETTLQQLEAALRESFGLLVTGVCATSARGLNSSAYGFL